LRALVADLLGGIESIGELDFAKLCAERGLPTPTRQVKRRTPSGGIRLDVVWEDFSVTVEIDGIHHLQPALWIADALKQNEVSMCGHVVLRITALALRLDQAPFLRQLEEALRRGGWDGVRHAA
jgi:very-short-patch-repair endonuclease